MAYVVGSPVDDGGLKALVDLQQQGTSDRLSSGNNTVSKLATELSVIRFLLTLRIIVGGMQ